MTELTADRLRELLSYDPETGVFRWKDNRNHRVKIGQIAGRYDGEYVRIKLDGKLLKAHRLAWLYVHGSLPRRNQIDHVNRDRSDNRIENLRMCTAKDNTRNRTKPSNNTTGYKGVHYNKATKKYKSTIGVDGKIIHLGYFNCPTVAHLRYCQEAKKQFGKYWSAG